MKLLLDVLIIIGVPVACAIIANCSRGIAHYIKLYDGTNRTEALQKARDEMKLVAPDLCLIAIGADFGASTYILYLGQALVLMNVFGLLLLFHFVVFIVCLTLSLMARTETVRIWYNNLLGFVAVLTCSPKIGPA